MKEVKRGVRTESLSLRIDPKTKFILEFMVRVTGLRLTDLIERAIKEHADKTTVGEHDQKNWLDYWHPEEGVRIINMIFDDDLNTNFEEDEIADFIESHHEFFFDSRVPRRPINAFIVVLWPRITEFVNHWRDNKAHNRWATGALMLEALKKADMRGPSWPRGTKPAPLELDDEIPF